MIESSGSLTVEHQPIQVESGGSNPTPLLQKTPRVRVLLPKEANELLSAWHYLGPTRMSYAFGHDEGCCCFGVCRSRLLGRNWVDQGISGIELVRMVGKPGHTWAMSSLMSICTKMLKKLDMYDIIVTYSDPYAGHDGATYLAAGWEFDGFVVKDGHPILKLDGKVVSPRTFYGRHGTQSVPKLKEIYGERLVCEPKPLKKRFIKWLKREKNTPGFPKNSTGSCSSSFGGSSGQSSTSSVATG